MSTLTESTISGVLAIILNTISTFKQFSLFVNIILTKTRFSVYITHSSVNFTWFVLLCLQKFDNRPLFKPTAIWFTTILNSLKTFLSDENNFCYNPIPNNVAFTSIEKKKLILLF